MPVKKVQTAYYFGLELLNLLQLPTFTSAFVMCFRDGTADMLDELNKLNVPVLIFSAGVGDVVTAVLKHHQVLFSNVKVFFLNTFISTNKLNTYYVCR